MDMRISVFGLGYVGSVTAACLSRSATQVIGVDISATKVVLMNEAKPPVIEKDLPELIAAAVAEGRLRATQDSREAVMSSDLSLVCVGTPSRPNGDLDVSHVRAVCSEIGAALRDKEDRHTVVIRSTVLPGTLDSHVIPALEEASGKKAGADFGVGNNPEFLREGSAVADFFNPPKTVIGAIDDRTADEIAALYACIPGPVIRTSIRVGEMVKYSDNVWHALKVAFANEIGTICKAMEIDSHAVMDIFCQDTKLNISPYYLRPGFAFGGSCLPKDVRALSYRARTLDTEVPVIAAIMRSNDLQVARGIDLVTASKNKRVSILGMSFKAGTDDLRESPVLELVERLIGKGYDIRIFDRNVNLSNLIGANREFLLKAIPHVSSLLVNSLDEALAHGRTIVVGNSDPEFLDIAARLGPEHQLVDLVRIRDYSRLDGKYSGFNW
jgi:GDP-mannose 6-dehydrogenase